MRFFGVFLTKIKLILVYFFYFFACLEKLELWQRILELWQRNLQANQNAGFLKLQYLTNEVRYEVELLCMWFSKCSESFQVGVAGMPGHAQTQVIMGVGFISRMRLGIKFFCECLGIHRSYKLVQSFEVGLARHAQSD